MRTKLLLRVTSLLQASLFLSLFVSNSVNSQKYVPFPIENANWNVMLSYTPEEFQQVHNISLLRYTLRGDTTINAIIYKKLCIIEGITENPVYIGVGGLRESNKQIFYTGRDYLTVPYRANQQRIQRVKNCGSSEFNTNNNEFLLYDFNVKEGETVRWGYGYGTISKIDSVLIGNSYRKRYKLNNSDIIIEGIGSVVNGLLGSITRVPLCGGNWTWEHICYSENGETLNLNPSYVDCNSLKKWSDKDYLKKGTQWYYGETVYNYKKDQSYDYYSLVSTGDTTINNKKCNLISHLRNAPFCYAYQPTVYMYQSNDSVYFYNTVSKKFSTLNVYGANKGDSWNVEYPDYIVKVEVDSVSTIEALGETLKVQFVSYYTSRHGLAQGFESKIIEGIGDVQYLFMSQAFGIEGFACDEFEVDYTGLRCYVHPDYGTYNTGTISCDYVTEVVKHNYSNIKVNLNTSGNLTVEGLTTEPCSLELIDIRGSLILQTEVTSNHNSISVGNITKGLYIYRLMNNGILLKAGKIVKNV